MKKTLNIIIADDDLDDQELLKAALTESAAAFEVSSVYNGLQLLDYLLKQNSYKGIDEQIPDLIFLDLNMPILGGLDALKRIHETGELKDIAIYILSTSKSEADKKTALELGARGYYVKPVKFSELQLIAKKICSECVGLGTEPR